MKKKLVAIAVAGLLAAPLASAQTANVTLYGRVNMDVDFVSSATDDGLGELHRVSSNASRIGVRGTESLGGNLNAIFQIESQFNGDTGANTSGTIASRDTFVGLQGGWGTVKIGHMLTPYDNIHAYFGNAPTFTSSILNTNGVWANGGSKPGFDARVGNSIRYDSPNIAGFQGQLHYATDELGNDGYLGGLGLFYNNAGLQVGLAYETHHNFGPTRIGGKNDHAVTVAAGYNIGGKIRPALVYEYIQYDMADGNLKRNLYGGSLTLALGPGKLFGAVLYAEKGKGSGSVGRISAGDDTGAMLYEVSYTYDLSKRTSLYVGYIMIDNDDNAFYSFGHNGHNAAPNGASLGVDQQGIILGISHNF